MRHDSSWVRSGNSPRKHDLYLEETKMYDSSHKMATTEEITKVNKPEETINSIPLDEYLMKKREESNINSQ